MQKPCQVCFSTDGQLNDMSETCYYPEPLIRVKFLITKEMAFMLDFHIVFLSCYLVSITKINALHVP